MSRPYELVGRFVPESPEWHKARQDGLGGSEIAAVLGLSPWTSRFALWHRKAGLIPEQTENRGMTWGKRLEPIVAQTWADEHAEYRVRPAATYRSRDRYWQIANPDRLLTQVTARSSSGGIYVPRAPASLLEVKTASGFDAWQWGPSGRDEVPAYYLCQVRWYLDVLGFDVAHLAVLIGGSDYREYVIEQDANDVALMRDEGHAFMRSVWEGNPPDIDADSSTYQAIRQLHPYIEDRDVELPDDLAVYFIEARELQKASAEVMAATTSAVAERMGNAARATWRGQVIATRQARGDGTPYLVCAKRLPAIPTEEPAA